MADEPQLHRATGEELDAATMYAMLRLRIEVFVVEQASPWQDLDGLDLIESTLHLWLAPPGEPARPLAYLRLLRPSPPPWRIGRVCVALPARGRGLAATLMRAALTELGDRPCTLGAQSHLAGFYAAYGFAVTGEEYIEDGIPHLPMAR